MIAAQVLGFHIIFKICLSISKARVLQIESYFRTVPVAEFHAQSKLKLLYCILDVKVTTFLLQLPFNHWLLKLRMQLSNTGFVVHVFRIHVGRSVKSVQNQK